jgi:ferredoxin
MGEKLSRRELFNIFRRSAEAVKGPPLPLRPPSAGLEKSIAESCMHCGACVEACPRQAIKPLGPEYGRPRWHPAYRGGRGAVRAV